MTRLKQFFFLVKPQVHQIAASSYLPAVFHTGTLRENRQVAQQSTPASAREEGEAKHDYPGL